MCTYNILFFKVLALILCTSYLCWFFCNQEKNGGLEISNWIRLSWIDSLNVQQLHFPFLLLKSLVNPGLYWGLGIIYIFLITQLLAKSNVLVIERLREPRKLCIIPNQTLSHKIQQKSHKSGVILKGKGIIRKFRQGHFTTLQIGSKS